MQNFADGVPGDSRGARAAGEDHAGIRQEQPPGGLRSIIRHRNRRAEVAGVVPDHAVAGFDDRNARRVDRDAELASCVMPSSISRSISISSSGSPSRSSWAFRTDTALGSGSAAEVLHARRHSVSRGSPPFRLPFNHSNRPIPYPILAVAEQSIRKRPAVEFLVGPRHVSSLVG